MKKLLKVLLFVLFVTLVFSNCKKDKEDNDLLTNLCATFDTLTFNHSMKGWELYSWSENNKWKYSLMVGTNAIKTLSQIKDNPISVIGVDYLKILLKKLPKGEELFWIGQLRLENTGQMNYEDIKLPPRSVQLEIKEFCDRENLKLTILE